MRRKCRECGCTARNACLLVDGFDEILSCGWVEPGLCSGCRPPEGFTRVRGPLLAQPNRKFQGNRLPDPNYPTLDKLLAWARRVPQ